jgi:PKD domain-containing protein
MKASCRRALVAAAIGAALISLGCSREEDVPAPDAGFPVRHDAKAELVPAPSPAQALPVPTESGPLRLMAQASADEELGDSPLTVKLEGEVARGGGTPPYTYLWDLGDGSAPVAGKDVAHVYAFPGEFRASLIVRDSAGAVAQDYVDISVTDDLFGAQDGTDAANAAPAAPANREQMRRLADRALQQLREREQRAQQPRPGS